MAEMRLRVVIDQEKSDALEAAVQRFRKASRELENASIAVQTAIRDMQDSLNVTQEPA